MLRKATPPERRVLAPSFDHASGLGFGLTDAARHRLLASGLSRWAQRGTAHRFEHDRDVPAAGRPSLVTVANEALALTDAEVRTYWLERLASLSAQAVEPLMRNTPRMSEVAAMFVLELLETNRRRLLP